MYENATPEKVNGRFHSRKMKRREYQYWHRAYRKSCLLVPSTGRYEIDEFSHHLFLIGEYNRDKNSNLPQEYRDMLTYGGVSNAYQLYITECIADYGGMLQEKELERQASLYHLGLWPDGGAFIVG